MKIIYKNCNIMKEYLNFFLYILNNFIYTYIYIYASSTCIKYYLVYKILKQTYIHLVTQLLTKHYKHYPFVLSILYLSIILQQQLLLQ